MQHQKELPMQRHTGPSCHGSGLGWLLCGHALNVGISEVADEPLVVI